VPITEPAWVISETRAGDAEIGDRGLAVGVDDHVLRLQVAMDDAVAVGEAGPLEHLANQPDRLLGGEAGVDQLLQRAALQVLHGDVIGAVDLAAVEDGDDVGVLEARSRLGLAAEALDELAVLGEAGVQHLERDLALQVRVVGQPDIGHPAGADLAQHPVAAVHHGSLGHLSHASLPVWLGYSPLRMVSATSRKIGAATSLPNSSVHSTVAAIAIFGSSAGANPMNQA
jgi:hypothetical protein